ncbi:lipoprotein [Bordetella pertussis]|nr:lipoprotein [Bordetella pertussis]
MRLLKPGQVMTMEYNARRLNIILEGNGSISALRCG